MSNRTIKSLFNGPPPPNEDNENVVGQSPSLPKEKQCGKYDPLDKWLVVLKKGLTEGSWRKFSKMES